MFRQAKRKQDDDNENEDLETYPISWIDQLRSNYANPAAQATQISKMKRSALINTIKVQGVH